jgi:Skp family chaperone for outer membrane proteins
MNTTEKINIIKQYEEELIIDTSINRFNILEQQMKLPGIKHKWVARLIQHKQNLNKLKRIKELAKEQEEQKLQKDSQILLTKASIDKQIEKSKIVEDINKKIQEQELIILYLEKVEVIFKSLSYDITNMVDLIKLEEM